MKGNDLDLQTEEGREKSNNNNNNNNMGDIKADETTSSTTGDLLVVTEDAAWGTYEELLLACAVNRHGTNTWDSIANELHIRRRFHSPETCRRKYVDLKRRFTAAADHDGDGDGDSNRLRIVEELRKLRVQQLKREVYNHDVSIVSLENKVKILEGGEKKKKNNNNSSSNSSLLAEPNKNQPNSEPSDLRIEPDKNANKTDEPERSSPEKVLGGDSAEDRSVNESNSNNATEAKREPDPSERKETASESKRDNSINNNKKDNNNNNNDEDKKWKGEQSSEVQSSASLSLKKRRRKSSSVDDEVEGEEVSPANKRISVKSQPLIRFLDSLLSHKHASVFHRRLPSQETEKYRNVVRQHMDLDMVQSRLDRGIYGECHPKFYRDLLLIFTNSVLFYRKSSAEHIAARELRRLVMDEIILRTHKPKILPTKPDPEIQHLEPVVKKPRSSTTMVVCRRRTSMQGLSETIRKKEESHNNVTATSGNIKNNITNSKIGDGREEKPKGDQYQNQKKVDGGGSSSNSNALDGVANSKKLVTQEREGERERSSLGRGTTLRLSNNNSKKIISKDGIKREKMEDVNNKEESSSKVNVDQKQDKTTTTTVLKKQGVANFLKRINQNSPSSQEKASNNNDSDDEEEDDSEKLEVRRKAKNDNISSGKKTVGNARKNNTANKEVDLIAPRRISGRKGEKEVAASSRATGRPPKRKAAMISGGTPDSGKGKKSGSDKSRKKTRR